MGTTIHLVRHGRVENPKGVIYGHLPGFHLSEVGRDQARQAAEHLKERDVGLVRSSPLERAQETALAIAQPHGLEVEIDPRLIESHSTFEGVTRTLLGIFLDPRHWWKMRNPFKPSWGETYTEMRGRMLDAIADAVQASGGREVVLVSHQSPVLVAWGSLIDRRRPPWTAFDMCPTGTVITLELEGGRATTASFFHPRA